MGLKSLLEWHKAYYNENKDGSLSLLGEIESKSHETNRFLVKKFSIMCILAMVYCLCLSNPKMILRGFGVEVATSPLIFIAISAVYWYNFMLWSYAALDDSHITYILHRKREITSDNSDKHLLHFQKFPLSIFAIENTLQSHFSELTTINKCAWRLSRFMATLTVGAALAFGLYMLWGVLGGVIHAGLWLFIAFLPNVLFLLVVLINVFRMVYINKTWDS